jgi:hypothetical protein
MIMAAGVPAVPGPVAPAFDFPEHVAQNSDICPKSRSDTFSYIRLPGSKVFIITNLSEFNFWHGKCY